MKKMKMIGLIIVALMMLNPVIVSARENALNLKFGKGRISSTVTNSVVRGDADVYSFNAGAGQYISIAIISLENNAVFELSYRKNGAWVAVEGTEEGMDTKVWYGNLPKSESNRYAIKVGGTRGNASYEMFVGISSADY